MITYTRPTTCCINMSSYRKKETKENNRNNSETLKIEKIRVNKCKQNYKTPIEKEEDDDEQQQTHDQRENK